jgi:pimeloyl-ACP methyl ester carboxylesterase
MKTLYNSEAGRREIQDLYNSKLESLNLDYESFYVETEFGATHILKVGDESKTPLVVVHGSNGCAPVALETYADLLDKYTLYAVDVLAQPNRSAETRLSMKTNDYGKWMNEVLEQLNLKDVVLAGFSFGGLIILKTLIQDERNIKEVFLSAPAYLVNGNPIKALIRFFVPMRRYIKKGDPKYLDQFLQASFSGKDAFAKRYLGLVFKYFDMDFTPVPVISKRDANRITTPIHLFAAGDDIVFPGKKMIKRAKKIFPSLKTSKLLEGSKHVQDKAGNYFIAQIIKEIV